MIVNNGTDAEVASIETKIQNIENNIVIGAIIFINIIIADALMALVFLRASARSQKANEWMRSSVMICVISMIAVFLAGSIFLGLRFLKLNEKYGRYTQEIQGTIPADETQIRLHKEEIDRDERLIFLFAVLLAIIVLADSAVAFVITRVHLSQTREKIIRLAYEDEVTGLPTKAKHRTDIEEFFKKPRGPYAYISLEIYNFKYINEMYGYLFGNYVLKFVAEEISKYLKSDELFARTSGSSYGLLLHYESDEELVDRLNGWFKRLCKIRTKEREGIVNIQFTAGVYRIMDNTEDPRRAREYANVARESVTQHFDNAIEFFDARMREEQSTRAELEFESARALEDHEFKVFLQPKYTTVDEKMVGAEALIRWKHPEKGFIYPDSFIPLFESNGFIVKIDFFVLEEVCKCIRAWIDDGIEPLVVSVNLSRVHLYDNNLVEELVEIVDRHGIPHHLIEFELTETLLFDEIDHLIEVMNRIKAAGFVLSMDDFGSGYSSLNMLKKLPVDVLKLDKAFMDNFKSDEPDSRDKAIISHVILMAKDMDMEVLAEGVETEKQQRFLKASECDMIQGYYYSKPVDLGEFDATFRNSRLVKA